MRSPLPAVIVLVVVLLSHIAARAGAQEPAAGASGSTDEQAQKLADDAVDAYKAGQYPAALKMLKQAYALRADPTILYNMARIYEKLDRPQTALEYYRRYLVADNTDPKLRGKAEEKVTLLGRATRPPGDTTPPPSGERPPAGAAKPEGGALLWAGVGVAAAGVVGLGVGVGFYAAANGAYGDFTGTQDELDKKTARDRAQSLGTGSVAGYAVGAALLGGGAVLIGLGLKKRLGGHREGAAHAALAPAPGGALLTLSGGF